MFLSMSQVRLGKIFSLKSEEAQSSLTQIRLELVFSSFESKPRGHFSVYILFGVDTSYGSTGKRWYFLCMAIQNIQSGDSFRGGWCRTQGFPGGTSDKESACQCRRLWTCECDPWVGRIPWRKKWQPTPVFLLRNSHGQKSLTGYSPWGRRFDKTQ